jgi:hypothetical protein
VTWGLERNDTDEKRFFHATSEEAERAPAARWGTGSAGELRVVEGRRWSAHLRRTDCGRGRKDESSAYHNDLFLGPIPEGRHHMLLGWRTAATHHGIQGKRFLAQFDSDHHIDFEMGDYNTLRFYIEGDAVDATTLASAVCTLSEA